MSWGGKREGAGRKPTAGEVRKGRNIRATNDEWLLIKKFAELIKKSDADALNFIKNR